MKRRSFLIAGLGAVGQTALGGRFPSANAARSPAAEGKRTVDPKHLPRWRGFNLLEKFTLAGNKPFREEDFAWIAELGFDFVRLPMDYRCWTAPGDLYRLREETLKEVDQAIEWGRKYRIHVNLNFHRGPGYCVNPPKEPMDLWTEEAAQKACAFHWAQFARRYRGIPSSELSFDLLNEPGDMPPELYTRVATRLVEAIREHDPDRLIIADGIKWGTEPVPGLASLGIAQSTRGYQPMRISHYRASWIGGSDRWEEPTWPLKEGDVVWNRELLRRRCITPWKELEAKGVGVHVGEWGAFNQTPHAVVLAWMRDCLALWKEAGWGWALWNFRGSFGILDSGRTDVAYEPWRGHQLDRAMLDLLQQY